MKKIFWLIEYDFCEGLVRFWKRYLCLVLIVFLSCMMLDNDSAYFRQLYVADWSIMGYVFQLFWGQRPFHVDVHSQMHFQLPLTWLLIFTTLAYCIGNFAYEDIQGFGIQLMVKQRNRKFWWASKVIVCIIINIFYFSLLYGCVLAYSWIKHGGFEPLNSERLFSFYFGEEFGDGSAWKYIILFLMVGIIQSLLQIILSFYMNSATVMSILSLILVLSVYYGGKYNIYGYAMIVRYAKEIPTLQDSCLVWSFGFKYLFVIMLSLMVIGYAIVRKKNIL